MEIAIFAAGCFWEVQETFDEIKGVNKTTVGYTGGTLKNPTYRDVCSDTTGHAEAIQIEFDSSIISYEKLLEVFWNNHNPMTKDRQGPDTGSQYRSAIFYTTPEQKIIAEKTKELIQKNYSKPIITEITKATEFYPAEEYHQKYSEKNGVSCKKH